jgi:hypothetical protein
VVVLVLVMQFSTRKVITFLACDMVVKEVGDVSGEHSHPASSQPPILDALSQHRY